MPTNFKCCLNHLALMLFFFIPGEKENNKKACLMILQKVVDDPQSGSCPNVSYADVAGPVANYNPTGSPYAVPTSEVTEVITWTRS